MGPICRMIDVDLDRQWRRHQVGGAGHCQAVPRHHHAGAPRLCCAAGGIAGGSRSEMEARGLIDMVHLGISNCTMRYECGQYHCQRKKTGPECFAPVFHAIQFD